MVSGVQRVRVCVDLTILDYAPLLATYLIPASASQPFPPYIVLSPLHIPNQPYYCLEHSLPQLIYAFSVGVH